MKKILNLFLFFGLICAPLAYAQTSNTGSSFTKLDRIVVIVNKDVITQSELNSELEHVKKQFEHTNQPLPPQAELRKKVLDALIAKKLQIQICEDKHIAASDEDVDKAIGRIMAANKLNLAQLKTALQQQGLEYESYKKHIKEQITLQKLQQEAIAKSVTLNPEDVQKFVRENKDKLNPYNAFHVVDITLPIGENTTPAQLESLKKQAHDVMQGLQKGKTTEEIMKQFPYAQNNDLGWRALGEFPSIFQSRVAALKVNSVSEPVQAPNGFHILKLVEAKGENQKLTDKDLKNLAFQQKCSEELKVWLDKLRKDSYVKIMN